MATRDPEALDRTLAALADPTRRAMVERLAKSGRLAISDLATPFAMSLPAVLKHVGVLTDAGLVSRVKVGRTVYCHLLSGPIRTSLTWLRKYENYQLPRDPAATKAAKDDASPSKRQPGKVGAKAAESPKSAAGKAARKPKLPTTTKAKVSPPKARSAARRPKAAATPPAVQRTRQALTRARGRSAKTAPARRRSGR
ncbi:MAG: metalloregulator ArsR/SmtB family transcription factor [Hyphomicrobiaceae bacterium]